LLALVTLVLKIFLERKTQQEIESAPAGDADQVSP